MDVILLFHLICQKACLKNFKFQVHSPVNSPVNSPCFSGHAFTVPLLSYCYNNSISSGFVKDNPLKEQKNLPKVSFKDK